MLIEVKQTRVVRPSIERAIQTVTRYIELSEVKSAVVYFHPNDNLSEMIAEERTLPGTDARVTLLIPREN